MPDVLNRVQMCFQYFAFYIVPVFIALQQNILPLFSFASFINLNPVSFLLKPSLECWPGYRMKGLVTSVCEESGWSALPVCVEGKLNLLNAIMDGIFSQGADS